MLYTLELYFLLFLSYAVLGWCMEVVVKFIQYKRFINRGFLIGPYCPIYGWGGILITLLLNKYIEDPLALFVFGIIICSILEYITSLVMEKIFHARWWDYSSKKFNINGRICLSTMIPFGLLGLLIMYILNPFFFSIFELMNNVTLNIVSIILAVIYLLDNIVSVTILSTIRKDNKVLDKDNTEEMSKKVREIISNRGWAQRRLLKAFPNVIHIGIILRENANKAKQKVDKIKNKTAQKQEY